MRFRLLPAGLPVLLVALVACGLLVGRLEANKEGWCRCFLVLYRPPGSNIRNVKNNCKVEDDLLNALLSRRDFFDESDPGIKIGFLKLNVQTLNPLGHVLLHQNVALEL